MDDWRKSGASESRDMPTSISNLPAIRGWKSAPGFSFFGAMVSVAWGYAFFRALPSGFNLIPMVLVMILYVMLFYPSYFTEKPRIISSTVISFLNCACMGPVFGICFNRSLKKAKETGEVWMGAAHVVAMVFCAILVVVALANAEMQVDNKNHDLGFDAFRTLAPMAGQDAVESHPVIKTTEATPVPVPSTSTTVVLPAGWAYKEEGSDMTDAVGLAISPPYEDENMAMALAVRDTPVETIGKAPSQEESIQSGEDIITEARKDTALILNKMLLSEAISEKAELVEINGRKYWKVTGKGRVINGDSELTCISYFKYHNEKEYHYIIRRTTDSAQPMETLVADMEGVIASAVYG